VNVGLYRPFGENKLAGDLTVGAAFCQFDKHVEPSRRKALGLDGFQARCSRMSRPRLSSSFRVISG
jgi:hypothetical protein